MNVGLDKNFERRGSKKIKNPVKNDAQDYHRQQNGEKDLIGVESFHG